MALAHDSMHPSARGPRLGAEEPGRRGRVADLAEVIPIRPLPTVARIGWLGSLVSLAREFASPRAQATSVGTPPRPPSSPALRLTARHSATPDDAA